MTEKEKKRVSKLMSLVLRHDPSAAGISLDANGWADVGELLVGINKQQRAPLTLDGLKEVVKTNDKKRFTFNADLTKIRANQGHSLHVDVELKKTLPPVILYHGTVGKYVQAILSEGLKPQSRLYVHLSPDKETAIKVGSRRGVPVILPVQAGRMSNDGFEFYLSENGVWLTKEVPPEYITE